MLVRDRVREGSDKATKAAKSLGIFSEDQLGNYGSDISFLLGINVSGVKRERKRLKQKYGEHESYGHDDTTQASLRL